MSNPGSKELTNILDKNLGILINIVEAVHKSNDLKEIYNTALDLVIEVEKVDMATIYLVDEAKNEAVLQAQRNFPEDYVKNASRIPYGKGITWKVIQSGEILNVEDIQKHPIGPAGKRVGYHGVLAVPIMLDQKAIGVIFFVRYEDEKFTSREVELLTTIGDQIAVAIARTKQTQELEKRNQNLSILSAIAENVHKSTDLEHTYESFLEMTKDVDIFDLMALYLVEGKGKNQEAVLQIQSGFPQEYIENASRIPRGVGVTWKVIESGEHSYYESMNDEENVVGPAGRALGSRSILATPLKSGNQTIGVIHFISLEKKAFSAIELDFLFSLGNQIGSAISKAKTFKEANDRARELEGLYENLQSAQSQLIQSEKLASLGQLVSSIAHEINNPLTPILGYSQLLISQESVDPVKQDKFLGVINESAEKVKRIVENLLSFARTDKPNREYADVNKIVEKAVEFREYQLGIENIEVQRGFDPELPKTMADANQLQQVFTNIILNAYYAMGNIENGGGRLEVRTKSGDGKTVEISIADEGPGIEEEVLNKIFDPFFTTKPPGIGTGLGLSVSYGIVKEHQGDIVVDTQLGKGTKFTVILPVLNYSEYLNMQSKTLEEEQLRDMRGNKADTEKVLIVEDEEIITTLIKGILENEGYSVDLASNGEDALAKIDGSRYIFIVCDIKMPQMDGKEFFNRVKTLNGDLASKILFITGDPSKDTLDFIQETGNSYLAKPFKIEEFMAAITDMV
jgi:signal transduction histidine kinase